MIETVTQDPMMDIRNIPNNALGYIYFYFPDDPSHHGMYVTKAEFSDKRNKTKIGVLGTTTKFDKTTSVEGSFSIEGYDVDPIWMELEEKFVNTGEDTYFNCTVVEVDPTTNIGRRIVNYYNCNIDELPLSTLDIDDSTKTTSFAGTFSSFQIYENYDVVSGIECAAKDGVIEPSNHTKMIDNANLVLQS